MYLAWILVIIMTFSMPVSAATAGTTDLSSTVSIAAEVSGGDSIVSPSVSEGDSSAEVTAAPTEEPTAAPTEEPTAAPTEAPTTAPTEEPTAVPSVSGGDSESEIPSEDLTGKVVNLALVVDTTGSMYSAIDGVKTNLAQFVRYIESTGAQFRISLIDYKDITCGEETIVHTFDYSVWSKDTDELIAAIDALYLDGGGDWAETPIDALGYLLDEATMTFNSGAAKFAILVTDAGYKDDNNHGYENMDQLITELAAKGIKVSVMTGTDCQEEYSSLINGTGGIFCNIYDDFAETLMEYAKAIISSTADAPSIDSTTVHPVTGIVASGETSIRPEYVYTYNVSFSPADATDKGLYWYIEDATVAEVLYAKDTRCYVKGVAEGTTKLTAVSRDGGYTSSVIIDVSEDAGFSSEFITDDFEAIKAVLDAEGVTTLEYCVTDGTAISDSDQKDAFTKLSGTEKTLSFTFVDGEDSVQYKWNFYGEDISNPEIAMDFSMVINPDNALVVGAVDSGIAEVDLHFNYEGVLPGKATVEVNVGKYIGADKLYLYYYNAETGKLELEASDIFVVDGIASFPLTHCSDYVLTAEMLRSLVPVAVTTPEPTQTETEPETTEEPIVVSSASPKTGDNLMVVCIVMIMLAGMGIIVEADMRRMKK